jgi:microcystin-dependent protein
MDAFIGEIIPWSSVKIPEGWVLCDGSLINIAGNEALYSLIGTRFGGNGTSTFGLPDLRGRLPIGQGAGTGLTPRYLAQNGGGEQASVSEAQIPSHSHTFNATTSNATASSPSNGLFANPSPNGFYADMPAPPVAVLTLLGDTVAGTGGGNQTHENRMPTMAVNYLICTTGGYYPTRP